MTKVLCIFLGLMSAVLGGGQPEVTTLSEQNVIKASHTVFEAIFVEENLTYLLNGEMSSEEEFRNRINDESAEGDPFSDTKPGPKTEPDSFVVRREIALLVTEPKKGNLKKHQIMRLTVEDDYDSACPHILNYGNYRSKQIYYNSGQANEHEYHYRTVREPVDFKSLISEKSVNGDLGVRIGMIVSVNGVLSESDDDPFEDTTGGFSVYGVNGKDVSTSIELKLDPSYAKSGGKLPIAGEKVKLKGYETIVVSPYEYSEKGNKYIAENPELYGKLIYDTVFVVTAVMYDEPKE